MHNIRNWTFTAFQTKSGLEHSVEKNESVIGRNLVASSSISSWKSTETGAYDWGTGTWPGFDGSSWVQASSDIIAYYMDPRNFLNDKYIYQFMKQSFDSSLHTKDGAAEHGERNIPFRHGVGRIVGIGRYGKRFRKLFFRFSDGTGKFVRFERKQRRSVVSDCFDQRS